jgi:hypothetical protein
MDSESVGKYFSDGIRPNLRPILDSEQEKKSIDSDTSHLCLKVAPVWLKYESCCYRYRNPSTPAVCNLCTGCDPGFYINLVRCNFQGNYPGTKSDCIPCHTCKEMQTIVGPVCPGTTVRNTQSCWDCTASCPDGTYISPHVERCNGMTRGSATEPFGSSDCTPCPGCPRLCIYLFFEKMFENQGNNAMLF